MLAAYPCVAYVQGTIDLEHRLTPFLIDQGRTIEATVVDSCQACGPQDVDLSPSAFTALAPLSVGRLHGVRWGYIRR